MTEVSWIPLLIMSRFWTNQGGLLDPRVNYVTFFDHQSGLEVQNETLRKPQNKPTQTESWPEDPILGIVGRRAAVA